VKLCKLLLFFLQLSFGDLAKYGGLYGSESVSLKNIEVRVRVTLSLYICEYVTHVW